MNDRVYKVYAIENGTVIDHIPTPMALKVVEILGIGSGGVFTLGVGFQSKRLPGGKDILKIENRVLSRNETDHNLPHSAQRHHQHHRGGQGPGKRRISLPESITGVMLCPNPNCATNMLGAQRKFRLENRSLVTYRCQYCERGHRDNKREPGQPREMSIRTSLPWLLCFGVAVSLSLIWFGSVPLFGDEIGYGYSSAGWIARNSLALVPAGTGRGEMGMGHPALFLWLWALLMRVFGDTLATARILPTIAAGFGLLGTWRLGRELSGSERVGIMAAFGLLASPLFLAQAFRALPDTAHMAAAAWAGRFLHKGQTSASPPCLRFWPRSSVRLASSSARSSF
ncbi:MAG: aspartate carbamoyltransferase regulatory subunit [Desulfobacterales bacterium]|nr:aspartate carbamoyltransferase regulatory subunit [Desulfobacterales bacterium]